MPANRVTSLSPWHMVFVLDDSGSMSVDGRSESVNKALRTMVEEMTILSQGVKPYFRVSVISFGSSARVVAEGLSEQAIDLNQIARFAGESGGTNLSDGLRLAASVLKRVPSNPTDFTPYVFVMTDGADDNPSAALAAADALKALQIPAGSPRIVTIGIGEATQCADFLSRLASTSELSKSLDDHSRLVQLFPAIGTVAATTTGTNAIDQAIANI